MHRVLVRIRTLGAASALAVASLGIAGATPASASGTWNITVGSFTPPYTSLNDFYPNDITVRAGDTVRFNWMGFHTVTFNPQPNLSLLDYLFFGTPTASNTLERPDTFVSGAATSGAPFFDVGIGHDLPAGNYRFQCEIHQFMHGVIHVTNGALPKTDADYQAIGAAQMTRDAAKGAGLDSRLIANSPKAKGQALAGAGDNVAELFNFYPSFPLAITVKVGQKLTFTSQDLHEPHTVTFGNEPEPDPFGAVFPSGNPNGYNGTSDLNSGFLFAQSQYDYWNLGHSILSAAVPNTQFSVTFTTPGLFPFYCALHGGPHAPGAINGMSGNILVLPADGG